MRCEATEIKRSIIAKRNALLSESEIDNPACYPEAGLHAHRFYANDFCLTGDQGDSTVWRAVVRDRDVTSDDVAGNQGRFQEAVETLATQVFGSGFHCSDHGAGQPETPVEAQATVESPFGVWHSLPKICRAPRLFTASGIPVRKGRIYLANYRLFWEWPHRDLKATGRPL